MDEQTYEISYQTPGISKTDTDYILPTIHTTKEMSGTDAVYFLQDKDGMIKIGKSENFFRRLTTYKTHNAAVRLVGLIVTGRHLLTYNENLIHRLWEEFVVTREWFAPARPLTRYIKAFGKTGHGIPMELIDPEPNTYTELLTYQERIHNAERSR